MYIQIYGLQTDSIVDGPGLRYAVFVQGCPHNCHGCHNPDSLNPNGGKPYDTQDIIRFIQKNPLLDGLTLTGGEPFSQSEACLEIAKEAHLMGLNVWGYSGYTYEELMNLSPSLLNELDVLVDGPFIQNQCSLSLLFRGSANQRIIDIAKTREAGQVTLWQQPKWL
ncbi:MAG: anaerobic ribonucleoside-triphosphate reductase activating protein [Clostridia bacterium]|nr:anaerobic ribonucleoside-triphosphate reductase activating protein [Clostridia bacterium]